LPGGRAVVGGFLVAVAAVGIFATTSGTGKGPTTRYLVAARALAPGTVISNGDLAPSAMDLPSDVARQAFRDPAPLAGTVVLAPLGEGELVQASALGEPNAGAVPSLTIALEPADAYGGNLRAGDRVNVYVTYGNDVQSSTRLVTAGAEIIRADGGDDTIGQAGLVQLTLAVQEDLDRMNLLNATHTGSVAVVRVTGADLGSSGTTYAPEELNRESEAPSNPTSENGG